MCGIAGLLYVDRSRDCDPRIVIAMRDLLTYRGPDDSGTHVEGPLGLGFRRLSIIDLAGGHQPMSDADGATWIVFNGEIYNYRELREELRAVGATFRTESDTEVILQLYATRGERCVEALNGMFAFAIWDARCRTLLLARDRMGVKPLYYAATGDAFVFASEIKALFASGEIQPQARQEAFTEYLLFRQVAGADTLFRGVHSLPPGCTMTVSEGGHRIARYWSPDPPADRPPIAFADAVRTLDSLLDDSVRMRLVSDVPLGTFCSGGVDSSLVTALAVRHKGEGVNTFSVGFDEDDYDESRYAEIVSDRCRTRHHRLVVSHERFSELLPRMIWHNDEPLDFANSVHIFALSELAKRHVTVVLTGEGSDELFAGYPRYRVPGLVRAYRHVPAPLRRVVSAATGDHRLRKLERFAALSGDDVLLYNASYLRPEVVSQLAPELSRFEPAYRRDCLQRSAPLGLDPVGRLCLLDQETFLLGILHRQDKMSMAAGIESRVPFMDYRIVEFANRLPAGVRIRRGAGKAIVKEVARAHLPASVVDRRKSGFGVPLARWLRADEGLGARIASLPDSDAAGVFDRRVLRRLVAEHRSGARDHCELLWTALNLATWREAFRC